MNIQIATLGCDGSREIENMARGWSMAMQISKHRLQNVRNLDDDALERAITKGQVVLETVCLVVHCNIRAGQFNLPPDFWKILYSEYGIIVYPSAWTCVPDLGGLGKDVTFSDLYQDHIVMFGRPLGSEHPPPDPFQYLAEPPPVYQE